MIEYVLFDLDGTLTDPGEGITNSVAYALAKFGIKAERSELYKFIGPPLITSFMEYYGLSQEDGVRAVAYYREYYTPKGIFENKLYNGIPEMLDSLKKSGKKIDADVVIMDPPRKGSTPELIGYLARRGVTRVVYVSCDPDTLARDCAEFLKYGYKMSEVIPVNMFPRTGHVENVVMLNR